MCGCNTAESRRGDALVAQTASTNNGSLVSYQWQYRKLLGSLSQSPKCTSIGLGYR
jgi:hypothetical protein